MSSSIPDAVANDLQAVRWQKATPSTTPTTYYAGLSTAAPTDNNGTGIVEPTDANYARVAVAASSANFTVASRQMSNAVAITWPASTSGGSGYGSVGWVPFYDAATGGTFKGYLTVTGGPVSFAAGVAPTVAIGGATETLAA